ncbi:MAG: hypothetical protein KKD77_23310, partial [Gammaproteobacteria bacterium]|nr:hypothetical protein [Gammaproteobacteria bacterium]
IWDERETEADRLLNEEIGRLEKERETKLKELDTAYNGEGGVFPTLKEEERVLKENFNNQITRMDEELKKFIDDNEAKLLDAQTFVTNLNAALANIQDASYTVTRYERTVSEGGGSSGSSSPDVLDSKATGGYIPQTGPYLLHQGETVIPANESMGNVQVNFTQPVFFDREDTMNKFVDMISKGIDRKQRLRFGGAYNG